MKQVVIPVALVILMVSCNEKSGPKLQEGEWWAKMQISEKEILPFNFRLTSNSESYTMEVENADELLVIDEFEFYKDSIKIQMPVFEGYIAGKFTVNEIHGEFIKESLDRIVPFEAKFETKSRFDVRQKPNVNVSGIWEVNFDYDAEKPYPAKGIFTQNGEKVIGTFRTSTGDYRYLEGVIDGSTLKLSTFDGSHVFLFTAQATDSTLNGIFYSGNHYKENFKAKRNEAFELADADSLTFLKEGFDKFSFSFPDANGNMVSLNDKRYKDKVVLVQIMGTWCPNCLDETKFYVDYLKRNPNPDLEIVGLAFEYAKTKEKAFKGIQRLKDRVGVKYPILLAQVGSDSKALANEKLPMLNHVLSYPTTIYIDKKGAVRKIHTGFNGPATGEKYEAYKSKFKKTISRLLSE